MTTSTILMTDWLDQNGLPVTSADQFPAKAIGFVYKITNLQSGKIYFGKKLIWFRKSSTKTVLLKNGTKKKKKVTTLVPSDWMTYWGSSPNVAKDIASIGIENFKREILFFCGNKGALSYYEARLQMDERVLEHPDKFYNGIIQCRVGAAHVSPIILSEIRA